MRSELSLVLFVLLYHRAKITRYIFCLR